MSRVSRGDWQHVEAAYSQLSNSASSGSDGPHDRLAGHLAFRLGRTFAQYDRHELEFIEELLTTCARVDGVSVDAKGFKQLYFDKRFNNFSTYAETGRRSRPKPFEASIETVRRIVMTNSIERACADLGTAAILGGSASYGRFYNTKGATNDPSDLDLLLVVPDYESALPKLVEALAAIEGVDSDGIRGLHARAMSLSASELESPRMSLSQTVDVWASQRDPLLSGIDIPGEFKLQFHIFSVSAFRYLLCEDLPSFMSSHLAADAERTIEDFRDDYPRRGYTTEVLSFAGIPKKVDRTVRQSQGGYFAEETVFFVDSNRFHPGIYHNLLVPQFEVRWDTTNLNLRLMVRVFRDKLVDRLIFERVLRPWEHQALAYSHIRNRRFSPHVWQKVLNSSGDLY